MSTPLAIVHLDAQFNGCPAHGTLCKKSGTGVASLVSALKHGVLSVLDAHGTELGFF